MEGFLIRGWDFNPPVSGATSTFAGGATLAARRLHEPQPISNRLVGLRFSTTCGAVSARGIPVLVPRLLGLVVEIWKDF